MWRGTNTDTSSVRSPDPMAVVPEKIYLLFKVALRGEGGWG